MVLTNNVQYIGCFKVFNSDLNGIIGEHLKS